MLYFNSSDLQYFALQLLLKMNNFDEKILVIEIDKLPTSNVFPGVDFNYKKFLKIISQFSFFVNRNEAETNYSLKQIIPYTILFHKENVVVYQRSINASEKRLTGLLSIGFGGHVIKSDCIAIDCILNAAFREIDEEIKVVGKYSVDIVGVLNDDTNEVGKVHMGIIYKSILKTQKISIKERNIENLKIVNRKYLHDNYNSFESWSKLCIDSIGTIYSDINKQY